MLIVNVRVDKSRMTPVGCGKEGPRDPGRNENAGAEKGRDHYSNPHEITDKRADKEAL